MIAFDLIQTAFVALTTNKLRTSLTVLGIVIGVGAVIALMAAGQGAQEGVTKQVRGLGSNLLVIAPTQTQQSGPVRTEASTLTAQDAAAIRDTSSFPYVGGVVAQYELNLDTQLLGNGRNTTASITATQPDFEYVRSYTVAAGRFITEDDITRKTTNVVLGAQVAADLFDTADNAVGKDVRLSFGPFSQNLTVIGVMEQRGASGSGTDDTQIYLPLTSFLARIPFARNARGTQSVQEILVKVTDSGKLNQTQQNIQQLLLERHSNTADFTVKTQNDLLSTANKVSRTMTILLGAIAGISLVVGGIGIMNIMLVSVTERTREIGIRKAVGASSRRHPHAVHHRGGDRHAGGGNNRRACGRRRRAGRQRPGFRHRLAGSDGGDPAEHLRRLRRVGPDRALLRHLPRVPGLPPGPDRGAAGGVSETRQIRGHLVGLVACPTQP